MRRLVPWLFLLLLTGCSPKRVLRQPDPATPPVPEAARPDRPAGRQSAPSVSEPRSADGQPLGTAAADLARAQVGRPYQWGGRTPESGFDCSGLVQWCYARLGVELPRVVRDQRRVGDSVHRGSLQAGDLVFFNLQGNRISHVGMYLGEGEFVHAPRSGRPVRRDSLTDPYWRERWRDARRVVTD